MSKKLNKMEGMNYKQVEGANIVLTCITSEARDLLEKIMAAWAEHEAGMRDNARQRGVELGEISHYGFAYWLVRYSGLIEPSKSE